MKTMSLDECIRYLDDNHAKLSYTQDILDVQKAIEQAVQDLLAKVASSDERFESKLEPAGSFYDGTKIMKCDEFDFMVNLVRISEFCDLVYHDVGERFVCVRIAASTDENNYLLHTWSDFLKEMSDVTDAITGASSKDAPIFCLDSTKLKQKFYSLLREAFESVTWPPDLKLFSSTGLFFDRVGLPGLTQVAASEQIDFRWKDRLEVSVDLALAIECKGWPLLTGMFDSKIGDRHDSFSIKNEIKSSGFHVVPKLGPVWNISWSRTETELLKHILQQNDEAAVGYRVAKLIKGTHFVRVMKGFVSSDTIKICESLTLKHLLMVLWVSSADFSKKGCAEILLGVFKLLLDGLNSQYCTHFFANFSTVKPGEGLPTLAQVLEKCIDQLQEIHLVEKSQVPRRCEEFLNAKIDVQFPSPPRKHRSYKVLKYNEIRSRFHTKKP